MLYKFVENKDKTWTGIGLTEEAGKYQGVVYRYGEVKVIDRTSERDPTWQSGSLELVLKLNCNSSHCN